MPTDADGRRRVERKALRIPLGRVVVVTSQRVLRLPVVRGRDRLVLGGLKQTLKTCLLLLRNRWSNGSSYCFKGTSL